MLPEEGDEVLRFRYYHVGNLSMGSSRKCHDIEEFFFTVFVLCEGNPAPQREAWAQNQFVMYENSDEIIFI